MNAAFLQTNDFPIRIKSGDMLSLLESLANQNQCLLISWRFALKACALLLTLSGDYLEILFSRHLEACFDLKHEFLTKMGKICWRLSLLAGVMLEICWRCSSKMRWASSRTRSSSTNEKFLRWKLIKPMKVLEIVWSHASEAYHVIIILLKHECSISPDKRLCN